MYQISSVQFVFNSKMESMAAKNFNPEWSKQLHCSAFKDHAAAEMHQQAMPGYIQHHAPIARTLLTNDDDNHTLGAIVKSRAQD